MSFATATTPGMTIGVALYRATISNTWLEDISATLVDGAIDLNLDRAIKLGGSFTLTTDAEVTPYRDYLAPVITIEYGDGSSSLTQQLGLYTVRAPQSERTIDTATVTYVGADLCQVLSDDALTAQVTLVAGTNVRNAVLQLISSDGVTNAAGPIPATRITIPSTTRTLAADKTFPTGTPRLDAANELLTAIGWYGLATTLDGRVMSAGAYRTLSRMEPWRTMTTADLVAPVSDQSQDAQVYNVVVVVKNNPNEAPLSATVSNTDAASPTSTTVLGRKIVRVATVADATTQADVDAYAARLLEEARSYYRVIRLTTLPDPTGLTAHQCVDLVGTGFLAEYSGRYWIRTAAMGLQAGNAALVLEANQVLTTDGVQV